MPKPDEYNLNERPDWKALGQIGDSVLDRQARMDAPLPASPLTTGAFVSRAVSTRFEVQPSRWGNLGTLAVLYGLFIGVPALVAVWAGLRIAHKVGWL